MLRLARWCVDNRRTVLVLWIVVLVAVGGVWLAVGSSYSDNFTLGDSGSQRARDLLENRFPAQSGDSSQIVVHAHQGTVDDPAVRSAVESMLQQVASLPHVSAVVSPFDPGAGGRVSEDGTIAFATVTFDEQANQVPKDAVERVIDTAQAIGSPTLQVELGGQAIEQVVQAAPGSTELIGLFAAVLVLLVSFGSFLAMGLPILTALFGLGTGVGLIGLSTYVVETPDFSLQLGLMIGLGVGIDYALFILTRFREAYAENGGDVRAATLLAMDTAGRAVVFAGVTVIIALMGMLALGVSLLYGVAIASSIAVLLVLGASVTLLPALLGSFGHRVGQPGRLRRRRSARAEPVPARGLGFWTRWISAIQRHPWWATIGAGALMVVLALPALWLRLGQSDAGNNPPSMTTKQAYDLLAEGFGAGFSGPLLVAVELPTAGDTASLDELTAAVERTPDVAAVSPPRLNDTEDTAILTVYPSSSPQSSETTELVERLRDEVIPPVEAQTGSTAYVGGAIATFVDFSSVLSSKLWLFVGVVVALSALLLLVVFRSLLIPLQAAVMNLLSIAAALGILVAIFQFGWGGLFEPGPIDAFIPVLLFALVFGLSMDYEVFLISRIHEEWMLRRDSSAAIRDGLARTGRVVTAAATVMIVVFGSFVFDGGRVIQLFGLSLATAVFLDAFVIRLFLLPAVLELLGRHAWTLPRWLDRRLPRVAIERKAPGRQPTVPEPVLDDA